MDWSIFRTLLQTPAWVGVLGTLAGGCLVGTFTLISKYLDRSSEDRRLLRSKLEDLHRAICKYAITVQDVLNRMDRANVPSGEGGRRFAFEINNHLFEPLIEITSITYLYAQPVKPEIDDLADLAADLTIVLALDIKDGKFDSPEMKAAFSQLADGVTEAKSAVEDVIFASRLMPGRRPMQYWRASWSVAGRSIKRKDKTAALKKGERKPNSQPEDK